MASYFVRDSNSCEQRGKDHGEYPEMRMVKDYKGMQALHSGAGSWSFDLKPYVPWIVIDDLTEIRQGGSTCFFWGGSVTSSAADVDFPLGQGPVVADGAGYVGAGPTSAVYGRDPVNGIDRFDQTIINIQGWLNFDTVSNVGMYAYIRVFQGSNTLKRLPITIPPDCKKFAINCSVVISLLKESEGDLDAEVCIRHSSVSRTYSVSGIYYSDGLSVTLTHVGYCHEASCEKILS